MNTEVNRLDELLEYLLLDFEACVDVTQESPGVQVWEFEESNRDDALLNDLDLPKRFRITVTELPPKDS